MSKTTTICVRSLTSKELLKLLREKLNAVVVAACTPSLHYETFAKAVEAASLNRCKYEMACIREHSSWVHFNRKKATEKAIRIISVAVAKVSKNRAYEPITGKVI